MKASWWAFWTFIWTHTRTNHGQLPTIRMRSNPKNIFFFRSMRPPSKNVRLQPKNCWKLLIGRNRPRPKNYIKNGVKKTSSRTHTYTCKYMYIQNSQNFSGRFSPTPNPGRLWNKQRVFPPFRCLLVLPIQGTNLETMLLRVDGLKMWNSILVSGSVVSRSLVSSLTWAITKLYLYAGQFDTATSRMDKIPLYQRL